MPLIYFKSLKKNEIPGKYAQVETTNIAELLLLRRSYIRDFRGIIST